MVVGFNHRPEDDQVDDIDFICEESDNPVAQKTPELTGWELVVFELADDDEPRP